MQLRLLIGLLFLSACFEAQKANGFLRRVAHDEGVGPGRKVDLSGSRLRRLPVADDFEMERQGAGNLCERREQHIESFLKDHASDEEQSHRSVRRRSTPSEKRWRMFIIECSILQKDRYVLTLTIPKPINSFKISIAFAPRPPSENEM